MEGAAGAGLTAAARISRSGAGLPGQPRRARLADPLGEGLGLGFGGLGQEDVEAIGPTRGSRGRSRGRARGWRRRRARRSGPRCPVSACAAARRARPPAGRSGRPARPRDGGRGPSRSGCPWGSAAADGAQDRPERRSRAAVPSRADRRTLEEGLDAVADPLIVVFGRGARTGLDGGRARGRARGRQGLLGEGRTRRVSLAGAARFGPARRRRRPRRARGSGRWVRR